MNRRSGGEDARGGGREWRISDEGAEQLPRQLPDFHGQIGRHPAAVPPAKPGRKPKAWRVVGETRSWGRKPPNLVWPALLAGVALLLVLLVVTGAAQGMLAGLPLATVTPTTVPAAMSVRPVVISSLGTPGPATVSDRVGVLPSAGPSVAGAPSVQPAQAASAPQPVAPAAVAPVSTPTAAGSARATPAGATSSRPSVGATPTPTVASLFAIPGTPAASSSTGIGSDLASIQATAKALSAELPGATPGSASFGATPVATDATPIPTAAPPFVPTPSSP